MSKISAAAASMTPYVGTKGYTMYKAALSADQLRKIRKDLTVVPYSPMVKKGMAQQVRYPIYLEDEGGAKIYLPYFYGVQEFGLPPESRLPIPPQVPVARLAYSGHKLRDNQVVAVDKYLAHIGSSPQKAGGVLELYTAFGKTASAMYIIHRIGLPAFIIVQQEFLRDQWRENIAFALPHARVGLIQGNVVDVAGKDIVLVMLQSLSMKEYPTHVFASCGLLIVDEVHHISSEVFCRGLFKIVPRYTLGLTATCDRKDNAEWVLKLFLGDIVYKAIKRDVDYGVVVRCVDYVHAPGTFEDVKCDGDGSPLYSCMISRLCETGRRTVFILNVMMDTLVANMDQQVFVLAHNRNVLRFMFEAIWHRREELRQRLYARYLGEAIAIVADSAAEPVNMAAVDWAVIDADVVDDIAPPPTATAPTKPAKKSRKPKVAPIPQPDLVTVRDINACSDMRRKIDLKIAQIAAFYLGGMKQEDLDRSEMHTIVLATYAMAAEALDIPTLTTLFLVTPKTDVRQSVGRILRDKNETSPVIWDFVDNVDPFRGQWLKRFAWYKGEKYRVERVRTEAAYAAGKWTTIHVPIGGAIAAAAVGSKRTASAAAICDGFAADRDPKYDVCPF